MIGYVEDKTLGDLDLTSSVRANHWTNFGPVSSKLEALLADIMQLPDDLCVVATSSCTTALYALVGLANITMGKTHRWCVSSYGFACTGQGPFSDAAIADCDREGMLDVNLVPAECDGLLVTNIFGTRSSVDEYKGRGYCIVDSALALDGVKHGAHEAISLHHTKPWGFGEGGCAIVKRDEEDLFRRLISFGLGKPRPASWDRHHARYLNNGKMSDIAASAIIARLSEWRPKEHRDQYNRILEIAEPLGFRALFTPASTPGNVPLLSPGPVVLPASGECKDVIVQKYYPPLKDTPVASDLYRRMANFPCHPGLRWLSDTDIKLTLEHLL